MKYKIIADSSQDLISPDCTIIPFTINIEGKDFVDDLDLDVREMVDEMNRSEEAIQTSCPSPGDYLEAIKEAAKEHDGIFIITISSKLSGSFNSAQLAKSMFLEENPDYNIEILDSKSAVSGETLIYLKLKELFEKNMEFEEIVEYMEDFIDQMVTLFTLESIDNLVKNGRMSRPAGAVANMLSIKPIASSQDGEISVESIARGVKSSLRRLVNTIGKHTETTKDKTIVISHVFAEEKAETVKELIEKAYDFKEYVIVQARGLSSGYAADKGIVIAFDGR